MLLALWPGNSVGAQESQAVSWRGDWNGMDLMVTIVARGHTISDTVQKSLPWWLWGNTTTDAYLFCLNDPSLVDLVLDFSVVDNHPQATLYPVKAAYGQQVKISEHGYQLPPEVKPALSIWLRQGQWLVAGEPNYNLEAQEMDLESGEIKWVISVGGDMPGRPQWVTRRLMSDPHPSWGYTRFDARLMGDKQIAYQLAQPLIPSWPYLSVGKYHYADLQARPIFFDPERRELGQAWVGSQEAGLYSINSLAYPPYTNFEAPFAFYRFDPAFGRYPNLAIRSVVSPPQSSLNVRLNRLQLTDIRMSWTGNKPGYWRYSLTASGNHPMDEQVKIGETMIRAISYWNLPTWVVSKPWKAVTFVEAPQGEPGSEGIYDYSVSDNPPVTDWVNGLLDEPPVVFHSPYLSYPEINSRRLKEGLRGEYSLDYNRMPQLYFSPVDNRLHLLYAQEGIWNLGQGRVLRTYNLAGGPYTNSWVRERIATEEISASPDKFTAGDSSVEEVLYALDGYLVVSGAYGILFHQASFPLAESETRPPVDKIAWRTYQEQLKSSLTGERDPQDLAGWLNAFPGETLAISGGQISGVRATEHTFRVVLELSPGFQVTGFGGLDLDGIAPGKYLVELCHMAAQDSRGIPSSPNSLLLASYPSGDPLPEACSVANTGKFHLQPLEAPNLKFSVPATGILSAPGLVRQPNQLKLRLQNESNADADIVRLSTQAVTAAGNSISLGDRSITVNSKTFEEIAFDWTPDQAGEWFVQVNATAFDKDGQHVLAKTEYREKVPINLPPGSSFTQALSAFGLVNPLPILLLIGGAFLLSGLVVSCILHSG